MFVITGQLTLDIIIIYVGDNQHSNEVVVLTDHMREDSTATDYWIKKFNLYATDYEALQTKEISYRKYC